jgi:streptogramin lyase
MSEGAGRNYVRFDRGSGQRIAAAVLEVERGNRDQPPLTFNPALGGASPRQIRMAKFTGAWGTGTSHVVTFQTTTSTPNTVMAFNKFVDLPAASGTAQTDVAVGKDGTAWYLISWPDASRVRMGTFTGAWALNASNTVTFRTASTPNTAAALNIFAAIATSATSPRNCAIAKEGTAWYLIAAQCT